MKYLRRFWWFFTDRFNLFYAIDAGGTYFLGTYCERLYERDCKALLAEQWDKCAGSEEGHLWEVTDPMPSSKHHVHWTCSKCNCWDWFDLYGVPEPNHHGKECYPEMGKLTPERQEKITKRWYWKHVGRV